MMRSVWRWFALALLVAGSAGCSWFEVGVGAMTRAPDWVYIHDNAKVGDRAVWKNPARGHHIIVWEVVGQTDDGYVVTLGWQDEFGKVMTFGGDPGTKRYFTIDKQGNVKKAKIKSERFLLALPMRVATPGEHEARKWVEFATPQIVKTALGDVAVTRAKVIDFKSAILDYSQYDLISPDVSFGVVHSDQNISSELVGVIELYNDALLQGALAGADPGTLQLSLDKIRSAGKIKVSYDLIENRK